MADDSMPSEKLLALFNEVRQAKTKEERRRLMVLLGEQFAAEHDDADETATDDVHKYFEDYAKARLAYEQAVMRIGRLAADCVQSYLAANGAAEETSSTTTTEQSLN